MRIRTIAFILAAALGSPNFAHAQAQNLKVAVVDMQKVFEGYYKTKDNDDKLKSEAKGYESELKAKEDELNKVKTDFTTLLDDVKNPALTDEVKKQKQDAAEKKAQEGRMLQQQYVSLSQQRHKTLAEKQSRIRADIVDDIKKEIDAAAKKNGFTLIFDRSGMTSTGLPPLLYSTDSFDISQDILKALNAKAPAKK
ncbi:MAG: OmpH family outer membrane protein [Verrucomicrobiae bacterium]|nr:OmpH family outer membrane protein [Verrucomicrobiae bacterium]